MKKIFLTIISLFFSASVCWSSPSNTISVPNSFSPNTTISSSETNANNNEFQTKYNVHTHTDITALGTVATGVWQGTRIGTTYGGLPSGAIFFMITGSCPTGSTDVTATYVDRFPRIHATPGTTVAATAHTHNAGTYAGPSHGHALTDVGSVAWTAERGAAGTDDDDAAIRGEVNSMTASANGTGSITGASASDGAALPAYFTVIMCQID